MRENRENNQPREIKITKNYYDYAEGSCLIEYGRTKVLCVATMNDKTAPHLKGTGNGWITAEYNMLPRSSNDRIRRERNNVKGRTQEIQRLIGRSLRAVVDMKRWGDKSFIIDCDVLQADGGTRTASITGAFVALVLALKKQKENNNFPNIAFPIKNFVSAISVGVLKEKILVDLDYIEDSSAGADVNLVLASNDKIVEIQGTAEQELFSASQLNEILSAAQATAEDIFKIQEQACGSLKWN